MFKRLRLASATKRLLEEKLYEKVLQELAQGHRRDGLWARALAKSNGIEGKAKGLYIQYRVQSIKDEAEVFNAIADEVAKQEEAEKQLESKLDTERRKKKLDSKKRQGIVNHHWSDNSRSHKHILVCSSCGDMHHGFGFSKCKECGGCLSLIKRIE